MHGDRERERERDRDFFLGGVGQKMLKIRLLLNKFDNFNICPVFKYFLKNAKTLKKG